MTMLFVWVLGAVESQNKDAKYVTAGILSDISNKLRNSDLYHLNLARIRADIESARNRARLQKVLIWPLLPEG